jgi:hypothetical protein
VEKSDSSRWLAPKSAWYRNPVWITALRRVSPFSRHAALTDSEPSTRPPARHVHSIATMAAMMTSMVPVTLRTATPASSASTGENASRPDSDAR